MTAGRRGVAFTPMENRRDVIVRAAVLADELEYEIVALPEGWGLDPAPVLPSWVAALGRHTTRVAAELADGWIPALAARDYLPGWAAQLRQLREAAAPRARPLTVVAGPLAAADDNAAVARGIAAGCTAWYLSAMGGVYARPVAAKAMPPRSR